MITALKNVSRAALCLLLAFSMAFIGTLRTVAESENRDLVLNDYEPEEIESMVSLSADNGNGGVSVDLANRLYISETVIETGSSPEKVKKSLHDKGYCVYDQDLNEGAGGYNKSLCSYLGYKVTFDKSKAITDLRLMEQDGGYDNFDYKNYLTGRFPGLAPTAQSMKDACAELKANVEKGKTNALTAKEVLNTFCVPAKSTELSGTPLYDYLTDGKRKLEDYEELLVVLNSSILDVINFQLAYANVDSELRETVIGKTGVTSRTGVTGYKDLTDAGNWLGDAAGKLIAGYDAQKDQAGLKDDYTDQIYLLRKALNKSSDAPFTERAESWLKSVTVDCRYDAATDKPVKASGVSAYDFLSGASDLCLAVFLSLLPQVCGSGHFRDVVEICAYDGSHRLPAELELDYKYDTDWINAVKESINGLNFDPYDGNSHSEHYYEITKYSEDISSFFTVLEYYYADYEKARQKIEKEGIDNSSPGAMLETDVFQDVLNGNQDHESSNELLYVGTFALLNDVELKSKKTPTLASYLEEIVKLNRTKTDDNDNEWIAMALTYPIMRALTAGQKYSIKTVPLVMFFSYITSDETTAAGILEQLPEKRAELLGDIGAERLSVWFGTNKDLLETETVAMTSQNVRRTVEGRRFSAATSKDFTLTDKLLHVLIWFSVGTVILAGTTAIMFIVMTTFIPGVALTTIGIIHIGVFGLCGITAFSAAMTAACVAAVVCVALIIVLVAVCLVLLIVYLVEKYKKKKPVYTDIPTVILDCTEDENNKVLEAVRYDVVLDQTGMPADINCKQGLKWLALYYSKEPAAGSPLTFGSVGAGIDLANERNASEARLQTLGESCKFFGSVKGTTSTDTTGESLAKFGQSGLYNLNADCFDDDVNGLYLWYYTLDSLSGVSKSKYEKKYISEVTVAICKKELNDSDYARSYILSMENYFLLDLDLAPSNSEFGVYLGYATTDIESEALRDIRVAYGNNAAAVTYGETTYTNALPGGLRLVPMKTCEQSDAARTVTPFSFQIFQTKELGQGENLAPPILAGSLKAVGSLSDIPDGCEAITLFGGSAYDFNSWDKEAQAYYDDHCFVYYSTERPYKSTDKNATEYLAGFAFFTGSTDDEIMVPHIPQPGEPAYEAYQLNPMAPTPYIKIEESTYREYAKALGYKLLDYDLTCGILCDEEDMTNIAYCTTYNPYRAITDLGVFTSEPKSGYCPDNLVSGGVGFESCAVFTQGDYYYYSGSGNDRMRKMRLTHGYFTSVEEEGKHNGWDGDPILATRAMYTAGYRTGVSPLKPTDVVISIKDDVIPTKSGTNTSIYYLTDFDSRRSVGAGLGDHWKTVHPLDQYFYDSYLASGDLASCYNLGLGVKGSRGPDCSVFNMFVRNLSLPNRVRGNYVLGANIVSSLEQNSSYDGARAAAMQLGDEVIGLDSPISLASSHIPELMNESPLIRDEDDVPMYGRYGDGCFFISVTYTNSVSLAVGDIRVMEKAQDEIFPINVSKQLGQYGTVTYYYNNVAQLVPKGEYDEKDETGRPRTSAEKTDIQNKKPGITFYSTQSGMKINRLFIQQTQMFGSGNESGIWHDNPSGAGDYYLKCVDTEDAFCFTGFGSGIESYICARRYDTGKESNYQYLSDITIVTTDRDDGSFRKASVALGAAGYPFIVEYDLSENTVGSGAGKSVIIGTARTGSTTQAIKDLKFSYNDYGPTFIYHGVSYRRVNDEGLRIEGLGNADVYLYFTRETGDEDIYTGVKLTWQELRDDPTTDWENVDWTKVDLNTIIYTEFSNAVNTPPHTFSWDTYQKATSKIRPGVDPLEYSVKNIGLVPVGATERIIWAGASENGEYRKNDTDLTGLVELTTFEGSTAPIRMVLKNAAEQSFDKGLEEYYMFLGQKTASAFADGGAAVLISLGIVAAAIAAYAVWAAKKKKENAAAR